MAERKPNRKLTDQEVEYMLAKAVVQQVPDIYQQASSAPITPLTVVDEIVQALGGHVDIESTLGQGTTVSITLPVYHPGQEHLHESI